MGYFTVGARYFTTDLICVGGSYSGQAIEEVSPMNEWCGSIKIGQDPLRRSSPHGHVSDTIVAFSSDVDSVFALLPSNMSPNMPGC